MKYKLSTKTLVILIVSSLLFAFFVLMLPNTGSSKQNLLSPSAMSTNTARHDVDALDILTVKPDQHIQVDDLGTSEKQITLVVQAGDSLSTLLTNHGFSTKDISKLLQADDKHHDLSKIQPGQLIVFKNDQANQKLIKLTLIKSKLEQIDFTRAENTFIRHKTTQTPEIIHQYKEVTISNSLFVDGIKAGLNQRILMDMVDIFSWDIDFALDIRKGDSFNILYEEMHIEGQFVELGNIIATQFINNGRIYQAIRYTTLSGSNYYTPDGLAVRKAFLRTPVEFSRISSRFNPSRLHPIFKTSRPHRGVDYAAEQGTPVKATGEGKVIFTGQQNGYGNVIIIDHGKGYTTLYAHLHNSARHIRPGSIVQQGSVIAYVGQTGWATGPHLHYEFRVNGEHKDPISVVLPNDDPMSREDLQRYLPFSHNMIALLGMYQSPIYKQRLASLKR